MKNIITLFVSMFVVFNFAVAEDTAEEKKVENNLFEVSLEPKENSQESWIFVTSDEELINAGLAESTSTWISVEDAGSNEGMFRYKVKYSRNFNDGQTFVVKGFSKDGKTFAASKLKVSVDEDIRTATLVDATEAEKAKFPSGWFATAVSSVAQASGFSNYGSDVQAGLSTLNAWRARHGLTAVTYDPSLQGVCQSNNYKLSQGQRSTKVVRGRFGFKRKVQSGHHVASGPGRQNWSSYSNIVSAINQWKYSSGHNKAMLASNITRVAWYCDGQGCTMQLR